MSVGQNDMISILLDNATTMKERNQIYSLTEAETAKVSNVMIAKLYQTVVDKSHIDFDDIPKSKGNITVYKGYKPMVESLQVVRDVANKSNTKIKEIDIVEKAIANIIAYRDVFEKGFRLNKEFIILQYNTMVASCVAATTKILYSYVDYIKRVDKVEFVISKSKFDDGELSIANIDKFNKLVAKGDFAKTMNWILKNNTNDLGKIDESAAYVGESVAAVIAIPIFVLVGFIALIRIIRYAIFLFYNKKMELSNYLAMQSMFLELNKESINAQAYNVDPAKKKEILRKQEKLIKKLRVMSDRLMVDTKMAHSKSVAELKKADSELTLDTVGGQTSQGNLGGYKLL